MVKVVGFFDKGLKGPKGPKRLLVLRFPFKPLSASFCPLVLDAAIKPPREAHHTFEAKLRKTKNGYPCGIAISILINITTL